MRAPVAVDAMGGDHAPRAVVSGAVQAARRGVSVVLVGPASDIGAELARFRNISTLPIAVVHAPDVVGMDESPVVALRRKPRASICVAAELVASGRASALFSAGHTGATVITAHAAFGRLPRVERPALAVVLPTRTGRAVLLDAGANAVCRPAHLRQFALMGAAYARLALDVPEPRVALLSIGEEAGKGNDLVKGAHAALLSAPVGFIGNVEARELFSGRADVIVCDGFTGNIALKVSEGLIDLMQEMLREHLGPRFARLMPPRELRRFRERVDYSEHGAAPLLGVTQPVLVGHGRSTPRAIRQGILAAAALVDSGMVDRLSEALKS